MDFHLGKPNLKSRAPIHAMKKNGKKCQPFTFESPRGTGMAARELSHVGAAKPIEKRRMPVTEWVIGFWIQPIGKL